MNSKPGGGGPRNGNERGFTLIEIVIALCIVALSMTAIFASFDFQQRSYLAQNAVAEMQQNVRGAMNYMEIDLRNAGFGIPSQAAMHVPPLMIGGGTVSMVSGLGISDGGATASDNVYIIYISSTPSTLAASMPTTSAELKLVDIGGWNEGDIGIVFDGTSADVFQVTEVQDSNHLQHNPEGVFGKDLSKAYGEGATVAKIKYAGYFLDVTDPAHPMLVKNILDNVGNLLPQIVSDDIEDMQIRLVLANGNEYDGNWFIANPTELNNIRKVRLYLAGRTRNAEKGWSEGPRAMWNRTNLASLAPYANYRRRTMEMLIDLRNAGISP